MQNDQMQNEKDLRIRTKLFALRVLKLVEALPKTSSGRTIGSQIIRSGTSIGANYRIICRARSKKEFISKLGIVIEEADETIFWLELIIESELLKEERIEPLLQEAKELLAIMIASSNTAYKNKRNEKNK